MNTTNIQAVNKTVRTKASKKNSLPRIKTFPSSGRMSISDVKKLAAFTYKSEGKNCENSSKIPRPQEMASYSFNETLKSKDKIKKAPSMIPRSKSRQKNESDKVKLDLFSKTESSKKESNKVLPKTEKSVIDLVGEGSECTLLLNVKVTKSSTLGEVKKELSEMTSLNVKSCHDLLEAKEKNSEIFYKDAQESLELPNGKPTPGLPRQIKDPKGGENEELEAEKQKKIISNLYETIKNAVAPFFAPPSSKKISNSETPSNLTTTGMIKKDKSKQEAIPDFFRVQNHYEFTIKEISNVWKDVNSLINSVRDHTVKFAEEKNLSVDKEQLTLEAEMLQLAIDFAISYSKLKTDFLIKSVKKTLDVKTLKKSELETFIDSKTFAAVYTDEDLAAMARTVQDFNLSVSKGEDLEFE